MSDHCLNHHDLEGRALVREFADVLDGMKLTAQDSLTIQRQRLEFRKAIEDVIFRFTNPMPELTKSETSVPSRDPWDGLRGKPE